MNSNTPVIEINHLVRRYGRTDAVNGLSLRVLPGRCYGFFGRNGAGKTTTIKCLLNLLRPTAGGSESVRARPGAARSHRKVAPGVRARLRGVLSVDERAGHARLLRIVPRAMERRHRKPVAGPVRPRSRAEDQPPLEGPEDATAAHRGGLSR